MPAMNRNGAISRKGRIVLRSRGLSAGSTNA